MNTNHPKKGGRIKVEPIRKPKDIKLIKKLLADKPRDLCLFTLGINTNLRASDMLSIKVRQVRDLEAGDDLVLVEKKTKKERRITLNQTTVDAIHNWIRHGNLKGSEFLFKSQRHKVLTVPSVSRLVKSWCKDINLKGNYAAHTLRKTFGYMHHRINCTPLPELMVAFNHSTQKQTLDYLCIQQEELKQLYAFEI